MKRLPMGLRARGQRPRRHVRAIVAGVAGLAVAALVATGVPLVASHTSSPATSPVLSTSPRPTVTLPSNPVDPFRGLGAWVDIFSYAPAYETGDGAGEITPAVVATMAAAGTRTLFLQTAGARTPGPTAPPQLLADFLRQAHSHGMTVVGWYAPTYRDTGTDAARLIAIADFNHDGQRFDGAAVDIETTSDSPAASVRTAALIDLSKRLRAAAGPNFGLAAITIAPMILTRINRAAWPNFPWRQLAPLYNAWIPMSYWTFRDKTSPLSDPARYTEQNVELTRSLLGLPQAPVYALGGVAGSLTPQALSSFIAGARAGDAIGAGIYSYRLMSTSAVAQLAAAVPPAGFVAATQQLHGT